MEHKLRCRLMKKAAQLLDVMLHSFIKAFVKTLASLLAGYIFYNIIKLLAS